ncbi:acyl carrier protein [Pontitalea aquivivens]|uniref:acyl carrier protein n=1 Tax=Pontitalea aquivivens TaxID=3388663 RepID=UPI0039704D0A
MPALHPGATAYRSESLFRHPGHVRFRFGACRGRTWGQQVFGLPFHDNWWQAETGGIMIANTPDMDIRPGTMGKPLPGITASIVAHEGEVVTEQPPGQIGELALRPGWPSMMRGYLDQPDRSAFLADLTGVAPDLDPAMIGDDDHLQVDLGLDSMDFLNLVSALHKRFGLPIPETDYPSLATPAKAVACLSAMLGQACP